MGKMPRVGSKIKFVTYDKFEMVVNNKGRLIKKTIPEIFIGTVKEIGTTKNVWGRDAKEYHVEDGNGNIHKIESYQVNEYVDH